MTYESMRFVKITILLVSLALRMFALSYSVRARIGGAL